MTHPKWMQPHMITNILKNIHIYCTPEIAYLVLCLQPLDSLCY